MKASRVIQILLISTFLTMCSDDETPSRWQKLTPFIGDTENFATSVHNGNAYLFFGTDRLGRYSNLAWKYTSVSNKWSELSPFEGEGRTKATAFTMNDNIYIIGGEIIVRAENGIDKIEKTDEVLKYDIVNNSWETLSLFPGGKTFGGIAFNLGNDVFYGFGEYEFENENSKAFWKYLPDTDEWVRQADFPGTLPGHYRNHNDNSILYSRFTNFVYEDKFFVITGSTADQPEMWEYDATANEWSELTDLSFENTNAEELFLVRGSSGSYKHNGKCYFLLGAKLNEDVFAASIHQFDPETHHWSILDGGVPVIGSAAFVIYTGKEIILGTDYFEYSRDYELWKFKL